MTDRAGTVSPLNDPAWRRERARKAGIASQAAVSAEERARRAARMRLTGAVRTIERDVDKLPPETKKSLVQTIMASMRRDG